jgi:hypothetical protein
MSTEPKQMRAEMRSVHFMRIFPGEMRAEMRVPSSFFYEFIKL